MNKRKRPLDNQTVAVVSHDAGGAEIVSSWVVRNKVKCVFALDGPAVGIFEKKIGKCKSIELNQAVHSSDWVLCSTGRTRLERDAITMAKAAGKRVVAYLDHWGNYKQRFLDNGRCVLPDEIWVGDTYARDIATETFPGLTIRLYENPYLLELKERIDSLKDRCMNVQKDNQIIYVCEPLKEHALKTYGDERYRGYTEDDAFRYFFRYVHLLGIEQPRVRIRLHPSERIGKYDWVVADYEGDVSISREPDLLSDIMESTVVVGCASMAMVVGLLADKRVISVIPPGGKVCSLPYKEIEHLQLLVSMNAVRQYD